MNSTNDRSATNAISRRDFLKITGTGLAGATLLGAAGCGGAGGGQNSPIKIGALLAFTGPLAEPGESVKRGMNLYFEQNGNTIGNRQVEILYEDTEGDPQTGIRKYRQLVDRDQVDILVGTTSSSVISALLELVDRDKILMVDPVAATDAVSWSKKSDYIHRVSFSSWQFASAGAAYVAENVGKTAYTIVPNYPPGTEGHASFKPVYEQAGGKVVGEAFPQLGATDFATYLTEMQQASPEIVWAFLSGTMAIGFIKQFKSFGLKGEIPLIGTLQLSDELVTRPAGRAAEGIISYTQYTPYLENETNEKFVEALQSKHDALPNVYDVHGYDTGQVISKAVEKAGSTQSEDLVKVLEGMSFESPRGQVTLDPETHNPVQDYHIVENVWDGEKIVPKILKSIEKVTMPATPPDYLQ